MLFVVQYAQTSQVWRRGRGKRYREEANAYLSNDIRTSTAVQPYDSADDTRQEQDADGDV